MKRVNDLGRKFAEVAWTAGDIQSLRPNWSINKCNEFLFVNHSHIQGAMVETGWEVIKDLLPYDLPTIKDIKTLRPTWTLKECRQYLKAHSQDIQQTGWKSFKNLLPFHFLMIEDSLMR